MSFKIKKFSARKKIIERLVDKEVRNVADEGSEEVKLKVRKPKKGE